MRQCIICRQFKDEAKFNDEHVIPDSIGGYYHIYTVCTVCNSNMGGKLDGKLTNHKFIEFQRNLLNIRGKSGSIPEPLKGAYSQVDNPEQKVLLQIDSNGNYVGKLVPLIKAGDTGGFTMIIDKKDEAIKDKIIDRFLRRNGIPKDRVKITETRNVKEQPMLQASMIIDIRDFKLAMLKIAYEFTVDKVVGYFDDPKAIAISEILKELDFNTFQDKVEYMGNGFNDEVLKPFSHLLDFKTDNHYLILFDCDLGLICYVNLFNTFSIGIRMSEKSGYIPDSLLVLKNDITNRKIETYDINQLANMSYNPPEYKFMYALPKDPILQAEFRENEQHSDFGFYQVGGKTPFFNKAGQIAYADIEAKLAQDHLQVEESGDNVNVMLTEIALDEELFIKHLPNNKLYRVLKVSVERKNRNYENNQSH